MRNTAIFRQLVIVAHLGVIQAKGYTYYTVCTQTQIEYKWPTKGG